MLLLIPLIAMQFTTEVNWELNDFVIAAVLLFGFGFIVEFILRKKNKISYRIIILIILLLILLLIWAELAVGIFGSPISGN